MPVPPLPRSEWHCPVACRFAARPRPNRLLEYAASARNGRCLRQPEQSDLWHGRPPHEVLSGKRPRSQRLVVCLPLVARMSLHLYSKSYLAAAQSLPHAELPFEPVRPYLVCHAIELALKAFPSLQCLEMLDPVDGQFGHKLSLILKVCDEGGIRELVPLADGHMEAIRLAETYDAGKVFEYPAIGDPTSNQVSGYDT